MSNESKNILVGIITLILNIIAPILLVNTIQDYTRTSEIVGSPSNEIVISEYVPVKNYVFQENLSKINFVEDQESGYYLYSYYFSEKDFDSSKTNYSVFVNDYICTITDLQNKAISTEYTMHFHDINKNILNTITMDINFEFYSSYSYLLLKIDTEDITYFNGFRNNPGFVLTLSAVDYNMAGISMNLSNNVTSPDVNTCAVSYTVQGNTYFTTAVEENTRLSSLPTEPVVDGYKFLGWSIDGTTIVDVLGTDITEDTTFIAVLDKYYTVTYMVDGSKYHLEKVYESENFAYTLPINPTIENNQFMGWSDGIVIIDTDYEITKNTTLTAVFEKIHTVRFYVDGEETSSQKVLNNNLLSTIPENPIKDGYTFKGWSSNGAIVDLTTFKITSSTVLTAVFEGVKTLYTILTDSTVDPNNISITYRDGYTSEHTISPGDSVVENSNIYVWFNSNVYSELTFTGATATFLENGNKYMFTLTGNVVISAVEKEIEVEETESVVTITGSHKFFGPYGSGSTLATGSVVNIGDQLNLQVYTYKTESVNITGATYTTTVKEATSINAEYTMYILTVTDTEVVIGITEKEQYDQATVVFNFADYEEQGYSFKVYVYGSYTTSYNPRFDKYENARELSSGDKVDIGKKVHVLVYKDGSLILSTSPSESYGNCPLTDTNNAGVYMYGSNNLYYPYFMYSVNSDMLVIQ